MSDISKRISELIEYKKSNFRRFGKLIGKSDVSVRKNAVGISKPNFEMLYAILNALPDISADWLILGKGEMLKNTYITTESMSIIREKETEYYTATTQLINCQNKVIELQTKVFEQAETINKLTKQIKK